MEKFYNVLNKEPSKAGIYVVVVVVIVFILYILLVYGYKYVNECNIQSSIEILLITDLLFHVVNKQERKKRVMLVEDVIAKGGIVYKLSSLHPSGIQLNDLTGIGIISSFLVVVVLIYLLLLLLL